MDNWIIGLMNDYLYLGMFLGMLLEAIIIIIPSELILAMAGILVANHQMTILGAFLTGLLGSLACAIIIYAIGYYGGRPFVNKYGKYIFMKEKEVAIAETWLKKYGMWAALIGRNFPIVRTLISFPIGVARLSFWKFLVYSTIGSIPWTFGFIWAGYTLGDNWRVIANYVEYLKIPIIIIGISLIVVYIYKQIKSKEA